MVRMASSDLSSLLQQHEILMNLLLEHVRDHALFEVDAGGSFIKVNRSMARVFGYSEEELKGGSFALFYPSEHRRPERVPDLLALAQRRGRVEEQATYQLRNGQRFQGYTVIVPIAGTGHYAVVVRDLAVLIATHDQLHALATADQITGLANRQHLFDLGRVEYRRWKRYRVPLCLVLAEIDQLKEIADIFGPEEADHVLRDMADVLRQCVRDVDMVSRMEGGIFASLLFSTPQEGAATLCERIRKALSRTEFTIGGTKRHLTLSLAALSANELAADFDAFYKQGEVVLERARLRGGNCIELG